MSDAASAVPPVRRLSALSRWSFGFGSVAYGIKDSGFATFLLLFYNQVVGLPAATVGAVIAAVLVIEAFADPFVGFLSDHTKSRWGRRHPWMYASAVPISAGWLLLWNPPHGWSEPALLGYLFGAALLVRLALSAFEIPSAAMGPELSADYDERTRLFSYRYLFAWGGGLAMLSLSYAIFLVPDAAHAVGLQNPDGYSRMALFGAVAMFFAIIGSSLGLHPQIKHMPRYVSTGESAAGHFRAFGQTVRNKGFIILMIAGVFAYTAQGISFALSNYLYQFVWGFKGADYQWLTVALFVGAATAFVIAPRAARHAHRRQAPHRCRLRRRQCAAHFQPLHIAPARPVPVDGLTDWAAAAAVDLFAQHRLRCVVVHHRRRDVVRCRRGIGDAHGATIRRRVFCRKLFRAKIGRRTRHVDGGDDPGDRRLSGGRRAGIGVG